MNKPWMRAYKFRLYPTKAQRQKMQTHLWLSKSLWNEMLELTKQTYANYGKFSSINALNQLSKTSGLYSQVSQDVFRRLYKSIKNMCSKRKKGLKAGFPRFKSIDKVKSLTYPQMGFCLKEKKLKVTPFGEINIKKHREIRGIIKTLTLKREPTDKWFAIFSVEQEPEPAIGNNGKHVGVDLGLINFAVLSDGTAIKNPRHLKKYEDALKKKSQRVSYKKKGSSNRKKAKRMLACIHAKVKNTRCDFLHKLSHKLVHTYSIIAAEDLESQKMSGQDYGKQINDAGWSEFISMLSYKAESAGSRVILVNPKNTTKECSRCGILTDKELSERQHNCPSCGLSMGRDLNAATNILNRATAGIAGSNACEDGAIVSSVKQEAHTFRHG
jgi:putative transposase